MVYYGITIKATSNLNKNSGIHGLDHILEQICRFNGGVVFDVVYELDSKNLIHLHATFISKIKINPILLKRKGWHIYLKLCTDYEGWQSYCHKDESKKNCVKYFEKNYGFIRD